MTTFAFLALICEFLLLPETKGITPKEMEQIFGLSLSADTKRVEIMNS